MKKNLTALLILLLGSIQLFSQIIPGYVDPTYGAISGKPGRTTIGSGAGQSFAKGMAIQPDNKTVIVGYAFNQNSFKSVVQVARLTENGAADFGFGGGSGVINIDLGTRDNEADAVAILPDEKILVACSDSDKIVLLRLLPDGSLDQSFGTNGKVLYKGNNSSALAKSMAVQPDGKIVIAGYNIATGGFSEDMLAIRFLPNGTPDNTFGTNGQVAISFLGGSEKANSVILQADGKIVLGGFASTPTFKNLALVRLNPNGTLDAGFGVGGKKTYAPLNNNCDKEITQITLANDGKILAATTIRDSITQYDNMVALRFTTTGNLDATFGINGLVNVPFFQQESYGTCVAIQPNGQILLGGNLSDGLGHNFFKAVRITTDGNGNADFGYGKGYTLDIDFYTNGSQNVCAIGLDNQARIMMAGFASDPAHANYHYFAAVRILSASVTIPIQIAPAKDTTQVSLLPTFDWSDVDYRLYYDLEVATNPNFTSPIISIYDSNSTYTSSTTLMQNTTYYWHLRASDYNGTTAWGPTWSFKTLGPSGVSENEKKYSAKVYPNPFTDFIQVETENKSGTIALFDMQGRKILEQETAIATKLNTENLDAGSYIITLQSNTGKVSNQIIKTK